MRKIVLAILLTLGTTAAQASPASYEPLDQCVKAEAVRPSRTSKESAEVLVKAAFSKCNVEMQNATDSAKVETAITSLNNSTYGGGPYNRQDATSELVATWKAAASEQAIAAVLDARAAHRK